MADFPSTEGLIIEIESDATNAVEELDKLTTKLEAFKNTISSSRPLATFAKNYQSLNDAISKSTLIDGNKIANIGHFADSVSRLNGISINASVGNQLQKLGEVGNTITDQQVSNIFNMTQALVNMSALEGFKFPSGLVKGLERVATFAETIEGRDFSKLRELTDIITNMYTVSGESAKRITELTKSMNNFTTATSKANARGKTFNTVLANVRTRTLALYAGLTRVTRFVQEGLSVYGDYIETLNLFKVSMEDAGDEAYAFAEKCQYLLGIDLTQWMKAQGVFMSLGKGFGVATDRAALMSQQLTQLAYDISSFYNINVEDAIQKVQSGFSGQIKPMRQLGYDLSVAKLEAIALSLGIDKSVKSMTQAEKSQLRYIAMLTQVKDVQGDLARTLDSPVNQMRILQAQVQQLYRSLGQLLLPVLNAILPYLMAIVKVLKMVIDEIAELFGYSLPEIGSTSIGSGLSVELDDLTDDLEGTNDAAEELKNTLASFDEINLIGSKSGGKSGSGSGLNDMLGNEWNFDLPTYDFLGDAGETKATQIANDLMKKIRPALDTIKDIIVFIKDNVDIIAAVLEVIAVTTIGAKLINGLVTAETQTKSISDMLKGLALVTIGLQLSYTGGQSLAQGNIASGMLKTIAGAIAAAMGGWVIAGVPGLAIGLTLSIAFAIKGYLDEQAQQSLQESLDIFFQFDEAKQSVTDFTTAWNDFLASFNNTELSSKIAEADAAKTSVDNIAYAISTLRSNFSAGLVSADEYVNGMDSLFTELEEAVTLHIDSIRDVILTALEGEVGLWMQAMGVDIDEYKQAVINANTEMKSSVSSIIEEMSKLTELYNAGDPQAMALYEQAMDGYIAKLKELGIELDTVVPVGQEFTNLFTGKYINFDENGGIQGIIDLVYEIDAAFTEASTSIENNRNAVISAMESYAPYMPEGLAEQAIGAAQTYFDRQSGLLEDGYKGAMKNIEDSAAVDWDVLYNTKGLTAATSAVGTDLIALDDTISTVMGSHGIERYGSSYQDIVDVMRDYVGTQEDAGKITSLNSSMMDREGSEYLKRQENRTKEASKHFNQISKDMGGNYRDFSDYVKGLSNGMVTAFSDGTDSIETSANTQRRIYGDMLGNANNTLGKIPDSLRTMAKNNLQVLTDNKSPMYNKSVELIGRIKAGFNDKKDEAKDKLKTIMNNNADILSTTDLKNKFYNKAGALTDKVKSAFNDKSSSVKSSFETLMSNARNVSETPFTTKGKTMRDKFISGYTSTTDLQTKVDTFSTSLSGMFNLDTFYNLGKDINDELKDGMEDNQSTLEGAADTLTDKMRKPFSDFGTDLYDYMNDMGEGIKDIWNDLEISAGSAKFKKGRISRWKIRGLEGYASGGFPEGGDFFFANENGTAEYIGTMNGKAAVANNAEIIKGVSDGVYRALKNSGIVGDVKTIANKSGEVVFAPSEEAGRVMQQSLGLYNQTGGRY